MNFYRPQKRKRAKMGVRESSVIRCTGHLQWVRSHVCAIQDGCYPDEPVHHCSPKVEAHHLQSFRAIEGGMGMKVGDDKTIPLCAGAHEEVHRIGQPAFERKWKVDLESVAARLWDLSPHGKKYRLQQGERA